MVTRLTMSSKHSISIYTMGCLYKDGHRQHSNYLLLQTISSRQGARNQKQGAIRLKLQGLNRLEYYHASTPTRGYTYKFCRGGRPWLTTQLDENPGWAARAARIEQFEAETPYPRSGTDERVDTVSSSLSPLSAHKFSLLTAR